MKLCPHCEAGYPDTLIVCPIHGGLLSEIRDLKPGMLIRNTYRIVRKLGQGGMGAVYLAEQTLLAEPQVLKFLSTEMSRDQELTERFLREVRTLRQIRHKNVVQAGNLEPAEDGTLFFSMEYVDGPDLLTFVRRAPQPFDVALALSITRGVAEGLGAAHALRMVHRDIKPENILMAWDGVSWVPKIADFGIVATRDTGRHTQAGGSLLTPFFAAPEQWLGVPSTELDGRTDFYALGGVLFEMLTGQSVFAADNYQGWAQKHLTAPPRLPSSLRPELAHWKGLDGLVLRLLAKDRNQRPQDVAAVIALLDAIVYDPPPPPIVEPPKAAEPVSRAADAPNLARPEPSAEPAVSERAEVAAPVLPVAQLKTGGQASRETRSKQPGKKPARRISLWVWVASLALLLAGVFAVYRIMAPTVVSHTLRGQTDAVFAVAFAPNGLTLASASRDNTIQLWDVAEGKTLPTLHDGVESMAFSPDGGTLAAGILDSTVKLWDVASGQVSSTMQGHAGDVPAVAFGPDGRTLASGSSDATVKLWDVASGQVLRTLSGHSGHVLSVAFSPDGRTLASGSADQTVKLWDAASGQLLHTLNGHTGPVNSVAFSPNGRTLASGSGDATVKLWDALGGLEERTLTGHAGAVNSVAFSPNGRLLASGSSDATVKLWDLSTGEPLRTLKGHSGAVLSVAFSPFGYTLASGSADKTVRVWDVAGIQGK